MGFRRLIVLSAPLPTITDYPSKYAAVANVRKEVTASMTERTELTLRFNEELERRCSEVGAVFVDATTDQLDPATRLIDQRFLRRGDSDHHLADGPYADLIGRQLHWLGR